MKKLLIAAALTLAFPAAALAADTIVPTAKELAGSACKQERKDVGKAQFKLTYKSVGIAACVKQRTATADLALQNAAKECKAERDDAGFAAAHDGKTFEQFYGTNKNGKNAYGKCVSGKAKAKKAAADQEDKAKQDDRVNAAKSCKKAKKDDADQFAEDYGTKRNAFGKCVSKTAKQLAEERQDS
jgi:opacity protein-like surface antigen